MGKQLDYRKILRDEKLFVENRDAMDSVTETKRKTVTIDHVRYLELLRKEALLKSYSEKLSEITAELEVLREYRAITSGEKKYYKRTFTLDLKDYKQAVLNGIKPRDYAKQHGVSYQLLYARINEAIMKNPPLTIEDYERLKEEGVSATDIAKVYQISRRTLYKLIESRLKKKEESES